MHSTFTLNVHPMPAEVVKLLESNILLAATFSSALKREGFRRTTTWE